LYFDCALAGVPQHLPDGSLPLLLPRAEAKQVFAHQHQQSGQRVHQPKHLRGEQVAYPYHMLPLVSLIADQRPISGK
jgi:hypothetical protein